MASRARGESITGRSWASRAVARVVQTRGFFGVSLGHRGCERRAFKAATPRYCHSSQRSPHCFSQGRAHAASVGRVAGEKIAVGRDERHPQPCRSSSTCIPSPPFAGRRSSLSENDTPFEPHIVHLADETSRAAFAAPPGPRAARPEGRRPRARNATPRSLLRPLRAGADAKDCRRQAAPLGKERSVRRGAGQGAPSDRVRENRPGDGDEGVGHELRIQHGRLRRGSSALLRQSGAALRSTHENAAAYLRRLEQRPSFARVLEEAQPYFALFPK